MIPLLSLPQIKEIKSLSFEETTEQKKKDTNVVYVILRFSCLFLSSAN